MAAISARLEETAIAAKVAIIIIDDMVAVLTLDGDSETLKVKAFPFCGIAFGFLDLADHRVVHQMLSPF
jgi:hypothetical protein